MISFVIPSYRRPEVLLSLLFNISEQNILSEMPGEILISVDKVDPEIEQYRSLVFQAQEIFQARKRNFALTIILVENDSNGLVAAKNNAVRKSSGGYILMLDDDLYMESTYVGELYKDLSNNPAAAAASGYIVTYKPAISHTQPSDVLDQAFAPEVRLQTLKVVHDNANWRSVFGQKEQVMDWSSVNQNIPAETRYKMDYFVNSYMFKKKIFDEIGGYNMELNGKTSAHEEVDFTYRMTKKGYDLLFNPFVRMWHLTISRGGIYKGETYEKSKEILEREYNELLEPFMKSVTSA